MQKEPVMPQADENITKVEPPSLEKHTSEILPENSDTNEKHDSFVCYWNDVKYSIGAEICCNGHRLRCGHPGRWRRRGRC